MDGRGLIRRSGGSAVQFSQLRSFLAVARHGGFTAAARALSLSQTTVTSQVQALERRHGVALFHRRGHRVAVSDVGEAMIPIARRMLAMEAEAELLLRDSGALRHGLLKIGAVGPFHVTEMIAAYSRRYPGMRISVSMGNSEQVLRDLDDYACDVAVLASFAEDERYLSLPYKTHPVVLFVSADHPFAERGSIALRELQGQAMIMREPGSTTRKRLEAALKAAGVGVHVTLEIGSREAVREAVLLGLGIGAVSDAEYVPGPGLRRLTLAGEPVTTSTHLYWLRERDRGRLIGSFVDVARELQANTGQQPRPLITALDTRNGR